MYAVRQYCDMRFKRMGFDRFLSDPVALYWDVGGFVSGDIGMVSSLCGRVLQTFYKSLIIYNIRD